MLSFNNNTDQAAKIINKSYEMLQPYDHYGRRRVHMHDLTIPAGGLVVDQQVALCKIPEGARVLGGEIVTDGLGASVTLEIGVYSFDGDGFIDVANTVADDPDFFGAGIDVAGAGNVKYANTIARNYGYLTEKALWVVATVKGATASAGQILSGSIEIAVD